LKPLLKIKEAAQLLKVHPHHLYRLIGKKAVPYLKIPGVGIRFDLDQIEKWIAQNEVHVEDWSRIK
jgi:excisionase family DNA binding protein